MVSYFCILCTFYVGGLCNMLKIALRKSLQFISVTASKFHFQKEYMRVFHLGIFHLRYCVPVSMENHPLAASIPITMVYLWSNFPYVVCISKGGMVERWGPYLQLCQWVFNMGKLNWFQIPWPKVYYEYRSQHTIYKLYRVYVVSHVGNVWIGPWANFPQYMDGTLYSFTLWNADPCNDKLEFIMMPHSELRFL